MQFALNIIKLIDYLPKNSVANVIANQLLRSATSVGANYRAACRARSKADFISKITIVEEEADESCYWLQLVSKSNLLNNTLLIDLTKEANELTAIFTASGRTSKINNPKSTIRNPK